MAGRDPEPILRQFPGPVTLPASRRKWLLILVGCAAFVTAGVLMVRDADQRGWLGIVFFGAGAIAALAMLLPGAANLRLDREGFEFTNFYRRTRRSWQDASRFDTMTVPRARTRLVTFDDATLKESWGTRARRAVSGHNAGLPDTYGLAAEDLARLLTQWRERAVPR